MKQNRFYTSSIYFVVFFLMLFILPTMLYAQPDDPGADPAPIDGGASIVAAACMGYLAKRKHKQKWKINN